MIRRARRALAYWGLTDGVLGPVIERENQVYPVDHKGERFALRLHRPDYRSFAELQSELDWMAMLARAGIHVPRPRPTREGALIASVEGQNTSLLEWVPGVQMGRTGTALDLSDRVGAFRALGIGMAKLHDACDAWQPPEGFTRPAWDAEGLVGDAPLWGRFWDAPYLSAPDRHLMTDFRERAVRDLRALHGADYGLIHADLLGENVLIDGTTQYFIDFDDGGWGYRLFDIATSLIKNRSQPDYADLEAALLDGYHSVRPLDLAALPLFKALRACTYIGWLADRWQQTGAAARAARNTDAARSFIYEYLDQT